MAFQSYLLKNIATWKFQIYPRYWKQLDEPVKILGVVTTKNIMENNNLTSDIKISNKQVSPNAEV